MSGGPHAAPRSAARSKFNVAFALLPPAVYSVRAGDMARLSQSVFWRSAPGNARIWARHVWKWGVGNRRQTRCRRRAHFSSAMNRLTFLKTLAGLVAAPAVAVRVLETSIQPKVNSGLTAEGLKQLEDYLNRGVNCIPHEGLLYYMPSSYRGEIKWCNVLDRCESQRRWECENGFFSQRRGGRDAVKP